MSVFEELVRRGWLSCPECGGKDLVTYQDLNLTETIECRNCQHEDEITNLEMIR